MRFGGALFLLAFILPSFSNAVPNHDSRGTHFEKRQSPPPKDKNPPNSLKPAPTPSGMPLGPPGSAARSQGSPGGNHTLLGTTQGSDSRAGNNDTGSLGSGLPKSKAGNPFPTSGAGSIPPGSPPSPLGVGNVTLAQPGGGNSTNFTGFGGAVHDSVGGAMNKTPNSSLQLLEQILNHTLATLPGLENLSDQVEKLMAGQLQDAIETAQNTSDSPGSRTDVRSGFQGSVNATTNKTVTVQAPVEMNGTDSQGKSCATYGYLTLSATTLTTLSGLFQSLVKLEKSVSQDGSHQSYSILQKARAQVSLTMFSVIKLTATPAVTNCHVPPSQTTFSTQIQANVSMCAEMLTKVERDLRTGRVSASRSAGLGIDASLGANSTLNSTVGSPVGQAAGKYPGPNSNTTGLAGPPRGGFSSPLVSSTGAPGNVSAVSAAGSIPSNNTTSTNLAGVGNGLNGSAANNGSPSALTDASFGGGANSSTSINIAQFAEVKASFAAVVEVTTGLVTSKPSEGKQGVHIGARMDAQININIKSRVSVRSTAIDSFLDRVNGGSAGRSHDALNNPQIQQKDGMGILQDLGGSVFGNMFSDFAGSMQASPGSSGGSPSGSNVNDQSGGNDPFGMGSTSRTGGFGSGSVNGSTTDSTGSFPNSTGSTLAGGSSTGANPTPNTEGASGGYPGGAGGGFGTGPPGGKNGTLTDADGSEPDDTETGGSGPGLAGAPGGSSSGFGSGGSSSPSFGGTGSTSGLGGAPNGTSGSFDGRPSLGSSAGNPGAGSSPGSPGSGSSPGGPDSGSSPGSPSSGSLPGSPGGGSSPGSPGSGSSPGSPGSGSSLGSPGSGSSPGSPGGGSSAGNFGGGSSAAPNCECKPDASTHLRIRSLEAQLERVHRVMHKRGLTEL